MPPIGQKDAQQVDANWQPRIPVALHGVRCREVKNVVTRNGCTTELFRPDWEVAAGQVQHMIHVALRPGAISAWHMHRLQTDHVFVVTGLIRLVLFDGREESPTRGQVQELHLSPLRPTLVVVPPGLWHGLQNLDLAGYSNFINFFDRPYVYEDPDEWRLPLGTPTIPYAF